MKQLENKLFQLLAKLKLIFIPDDYHKDIETGVEHIVSEHFDALQKLEKYDTGELEKPAELARYTSVQSYLRSLSKTTRAQS